MTKLRNQFQPLDYKGFDTIPSIIDTLARYHLILSTYVKTQARPHIIAIFLFFLITYPLLAQKIPYLTVSDTINVGTAEYILGHIQKAESENAPYLIISLDTQGGALHATRKIVQGILNSNIPVVVYVSPQGAHATSAGTFITLAADIAAMSPSTHLGAATPVSASGNLEDTMKKKAISDTTAFIKSIALQQKRNIDLAVSTVVDSKSFTAQEAYKHNLIDLIAENRSELLEKLRGFPLKREKGGVLNLPQPPYEFNEKPPSIKEKLLSFFAHPQMALWVLSLGGLCLWIELTNPGLFVPGIISAVCFIISLISLQMLPINIGALALLLFSFVLMIAEIFVTSFGLLAIGGLVSFTLGSLFLIDKQFPDLQIKIEDILPLLLIMGLTFLSFSWLILKSRKTKKRSGRDSDTGQTVTLTEDIEPGKKGNVYFQGELWKAQNQTQEPLKKNEEATITQVEGMTLQIKKQDQKK